MLVLSRVIGETIYVGDGIKITICSVDRGKVRVGIDAPRGLKVLRGEFVPGDRHYRHPEPEGGAS